MALAIFLVSYVFIAGFKVPGLPLERTSGALLGAAAMVAFGVVTPAQITEAVDVDTIILLFGMMLLAAYLKQAEFFSASSHAVLKLSRSPRGLLIAVVAISGVLSAFLVNDTVCLMLTPVVLMLVRSAKVPPLPYLLALCMASNAGSVATFTGNPQNMIIGGASGISWATFVALMALPAVLSLLIVFALLAWFFRKDLQARTITPEEAPPKTDRKLLTICFLALAGVIAAFFAGFSMAWSAVIGAVAVMVVARVPPAKQIEAVDYSLLVFFAALFIIVFGVHQEHWATRLHDAFKPLLTGGTVREAFGFSLLTLVGSNIFSNVPFVMLAREWAQTPLMWELLALASTLAGNLTLVGSVANLIVFEGAKGEVRVTFWEYLRIGVPVTLLSLVVGVAVLLLENRLLTGG